MRVDIVTGWTEREAVWGNGHERVGGAIHRARQRLPMPLLGWDSDSGSEFINEAFWRDCQREGITFTRGRAYRDNHAHVKQKNGAVVRRWIGYDRFTTKPAYGALHAVYRVLCLHVNFFQPVQKLVARVRVEGPRPRRVRPGPDAVSTPLCHRRAQGDGREALARLYHSLNPLQLRRQLDAALERLWALAAPAPPLPSGIRHESAGGTVAQWAQDRRSRADPYRDIPPPASRTAVRPRPLGNRHL